MTDLPDPLDELASAHLDGATTPEEAARIAADPALQARVEELRVARDALRAAAVAPVDAARRNAAVAAALAAFHEADTSHPPASAPVTSLAEVATRRRTPGLALRVLGAAAVLVLVALLVPLLAGQDDDAAETADRASEELQDSVADAADDGSAPAQPEGDTGSEAAGGADAPTTTFGAASDRLGYLGSFDDIDALAAAVAGGDLHLAPTSADYASALPCVEARQTAFDSTVVFAAGATVAGEPVEVAVVNGEDGARTMTVLRADSCTLLGTRDL
jgi:negative regulator of sigma E activity